jgi:hypothetical protein
MELIWPGALDGDEEFAECIKQPEFADASFSVWLFRVEGDESLIKAGCGAILAGTTDGLPEDEVVWVSPAELAKAAATLKHLVEREDKSIAEAVWEYEDCYERGTPEKRALLDDLEVVRQKALWAQALGKSRVTFNLQA